MSTIKITLSRGDLESLLLSENGEIKVEIGQQIADAFAAKYLKSIIHDAFTQKLQETANVIAFEQWKELTVGPYNAPSIALKNIISAEIRRNTELYISEQAQKAIGKAEKVLTEKFSSEKIAEAIERRVTANVDKEIEKGVREAINRALKPLPPSPKGE